MNKVDPDFIVSTSVPFDFRKISFSEFFKIKDHVKAVSILWEYNSYFINVHEGIFIINGGKKVRPIYLDKMTDLKLEYARRNRMDVVLDTTEKIKTREIQIVYLFGIKGKYYDGTEKMILLQISQDGSCWAWKDSR